MDSEIVAGSIPLDPGRRAAPQVYEWLREQILTLNYAPGTTLSRADLVTRFGLSQTPIRDALMRLSTEGLVDIFPQSATRVSAIDVQQAIQTHFLRRALEIEIAHTLALASEKPFISDLETIISKQEGLLASADLNAFDTHDRAFHQVLYQSAGVPDLWTVIRDRSGHIDRLRRIDLPMPGKLEAIIASHKAIVAAIASSRAAEAQHHVREHLSGTLSHIDEIRATHPAYVKG